MTPIVAVKSGFRRYAGFSGRASRSEFWWWALFLALVFGLFGIVYGYSQSSPTIAGVIWLAVGGLVLPTLAVAVRRLHDTGRSGWWYLITIVPFGSFVLLWWFCVAGDPLPNRFGLPPGLPIGGSTGGSEPSSAEVDAGMSQSSSGSSEWLAARPLAPLEQLHHYAEVAGFWRRAGAGAIDGAPVLIATIAAPLLVDRLGAGYVPFLSGLELAFAIYLVVCWSRIGGGRTVGARVLGVRVVDVDGRPISVWRALIRVAGLLLALLPLGFGWLRLAWDPNSQAWHDRLAKTYVVVAPRSASPDSEPLPVNRAPTRAWPLAVEGLGGLLIFVGQYVLLWALSNAPWDTYSSPTLGYSMSVPDSWTVAEGTGQDVWEFSGARVVVARVPSRGATLAEVLAAEEQDIAGADKVRFDGATATTLGGSPAQLLAFRETSPNGAFLWEVVSLRGNNAWLLSWSDVGGRESTDRATFDRLRLSFSVQTPN